MKQDGVNTSRSYSTSLATYITKLSTTSRSAAKTSLDEITTMDEMARVIAGLKDGKAPGEMEFLHNTRGSSGDTMWLQM